MSEDIFSQFFNLFNNDEEIQNHISLIKEEISVSNKDERMLELKNWINIIKRC